jgi:hypothetical protein
MKIKGQITQILEEQTGEKSERQMGKKKFFT